MKVGFNLLFLLPEKVGGTETYSRGMIESLEKLDKENEFFIFCNRENFQSFKFKSKNFQKVFSPVKASIRFLRILWEQAVLPIQAWFKKIDVLVSLGYVCPLFISCKSIVVIYDLNWFFHPEEFSFLERIAWKTLVSFSAKRADLIVTTSKNSKKDITRILKIPKGKISVVYGGIDRERFKPIKNGKGHTVIKEKYGIKDRFLLTVSASYYFKNLDKLIDAFKDISEKFSDLQLLVVGLSGRAKPGILKKIKKYNFENKVIIAGWVPDEDLPLLYSAAEVYIHPSLYEGFGLPVLEAMACGCPVVSSNAASLPELVGDAAILADATETQALKNAIIKILTNQKLRKELILKGLKRVKKFTWIQTATTVRNLIRKL